MLSMAGPVQEIYLVDAKTGSGSIVMGDKDTKADATFILKDEDFIAMACTLRYWCLFRRNDS